ncbi:C-type lectin-like isoform X2 [Convolutriloba macropyga]|uniref:C-type lectin-like isoform X2 n=1 Tax=Convolutriloba macropyga TaxID=536237 RepID=UPI003F51C96D
MFLCKALPLFLLLGIKLTAGEDELCPNDFVGVSGADQKCYFYSKTVARYSPGARRECAKLTPTAVLFEPESVEVAQAVWNYLATKGVKTKIWTGLHKSQGNWIKHSNNKVFVVPFELWGMGEPNNHNNEENCVQMTNGVLQDINCDNRLHFVCEFTKNITMNTRSEM